MGTAITDVGGVSELEGETSQLVSPGDLEALAAAIGRLRDDPDLRTCMGRAEFSESRMADDYERMLRGSAPLAGASHQKCRAGLDLT